MYNLSVQTFQIMSLITQDIWIVQIIAFLEFVKCVVKAKLDFLMNATNISLALLYQLVPNTLRQTTHYCTRSSEHVVFFVFVQK